MAYGFSSYLSLSCQVWTFCDNDTNNIPTLHNDEAPSIHNELCNGRSAWEVMRDHEDFKDGQCVRGGVRLYVRAFGRAGMRVCA